jgi:hypothetical protein
VWASAAEDRIALIEEMLPIQERIVATRQRLRVAFRDAAVSLYLREKAGGPVSKTPLPPEMWLTEAWQQRFIFCQFDPSRPFDGSAVTGDWLFVSKDELGGLQSAAQARVTPAKPGRPRGAPKGSGEIDDSIPITRILEAERGGLTKWQATISEAQSLCDGKEADLERHKFRLWKKVKDLPPLGAEAK